MAQDIKFNDLTTLSNPKVHMKDKAAVLKKINSIARSGPNKLQLVADFDLTLTKQREEGVSVLSSWCIFEKSEQLPHSVKEGFAELSKKYHPIDVDPNVPMDRKIQVQKDWMTAGHKLLIGLEYDRKEIQEVTRKYGQSLRDRTKELFFKLNHHKVPILIFSAGVGDIVEAALNQQQVLLDNVKIISNFLAFDGNKLMGLKNHANLIHVYNKNEHSIDHEYFKLVKERKNVILLGDSLGDAKMTEGLKGTENVLKIGFLMDEIKLASYKEVFDIVLVDDQTMNAVLDIISVMF